MNEGGAETLWAYAALTHGGPTPRLCPTAASLLHSSILRSGLQQSVPFLAIRDNNYYDENTKMPETTASS